MTTNNFSQNVNFGPAPIGQQTSNPFMMNQIVFNPFMTSLPNQQVQQQYMNYMNQMNQMMQQQLIIQQQMMQNPMFNFTNQQLQQHTDHIETQPDEMPNENITSVKKKNKTTKRLNKTGNRKTKITEHIIEQKMDTNIDDDIDAITSKMSNIKIATSIKQAKNKKKKPVQNIDSDVIEFIQPTEYSNKYKVKYLDGSLEILDKNMISKSVLKTYKLTKNHNCKLNNNVVNSGVIYVRTSSPNCISIDTQFASCSEYAVTKNILLYNTSYGYLEDNGVSARFMKNLDKELGFWTHKFISGTNLIFYTIDRLSRNYNKAQEYIDMLLNRDVKIHFVLENIVLSKKDQSKRHIVNDLLQTAEEFSNQTSERVKKSLDRLKKEFNYVGGSTKYGYKSIRDSKTEKFYIVEDDDEQYSIEIIMQYWYDCCEDIIQLTNKLEEKKIYNIRTHKPFTRQFLSNIINRPVINKTPLKRLDKTKKK